VGGTPFGFIGLERVGGFMVYDLTLPESPRFVSYVNTRDFTTTLPGDLATAGDLALSAPSSSPRRKAQLASLCSSSATKPAAPPRSSS
jgi:hypothetical protein